MASPSFKKEIFTEDSILVFHSIISDRLTDDAVANATLRVDETARGQAWFSPENPSIIVALGLILIRARLLAFLVRRTKARRAEGGRPEHEIDPSRDGTFIERSLLVFVEF